MNPSDMEMAQHFTDIELQTLDLTMLYHEALWILYRSKVKSHNQVVSMDLAPQRFQGFPHIASIRRVTWVRNLGAPFMAATSRYPEISP